MPDVRPMTLKEWQGMSYCKAMAHETQERIRAALADRERMLRAWPDLIELAKRWYRNGCACHLRESPCSPCVARKALELAGEP